MTEIKLNGAVWKFDDSQPLGAAGGFGAVFIGESEDGAAVAVKRLHISAGDAAHRELRVAEDLIAASYEHVIPVLDAGQDADSDRYFIVMPIASGSLNDHIQSNGKLDLPEAADVLLQIAKGLREAGRLVHRDLKPANVLMHEGSWKIADFGIARFVADSTSINTLKSCLSPQYAAPEQWRMERATPATDIYALGCIAHACVNGSPPFSGNFDRVREQHLNDSPPSLGGESPRMRGLVATLLRKNPLSRPSLSRVIDQLEDIKDAGGPGSAGGGWGALEKAGAAVAEAEATAEAEREKEVSAQQARNQLYKAALEILWSQVDDLFGRISSAAPTAQRTLKGKLILGRGAIEVSELRQNPIGPDQFPNSGWDVICGAVIGVTQSEPEGMWSSSLWYAKRHLADEYRWREVSYWSLGNERRPPPYYLDNLRDADFAMSNVMHTYQIAWGHSLLTTRMLRTSITVGRNSCLALLRGGWADQCVCRYNDRQSRITSASTRTQGGSAISAPTWFAAAQLLN